jgi:hypothetical protein
MGILSGIGFGRYHYRSATAQAVDGLGRILAPGSSAQVTKQTRQIVADFVRGEVSKGSCSKKSGECAIESTGDKLVIEGETLASRSAPGSDIVKVCIPKRVKFVTDKNGKQKPEMKSQELKAASSVLMRILGTGIGARTLKGGTVALNSRATRPGGAKALVPGDCIEVMLTSDMRDTALDLMNARRDVVRELPAGEKVTRAKVRKQAKKLRKARADERAAAAKEKRLAALAKARAARKEAAESKKAAAEAKKAGDTATAKAEAADAKKAEATAKKAESEAKKAAATEKAAKAAPKAPGTKKADKK